MGGGRRLTPVERPVNPHRRLDSLHGVVDGPKRGRVGGRPDGGGRVAVHDILRNTIRSKESILQGEQEGKSFYEIQEQGRATYHMQTFDQAIVDAYEEGLITEETAVAYGSRKAVVQRALDKVCNPELVRNLWTLLNCGRNTPYPGSIEGICLRTRSSNLDSGLKNRCKPQGIGNPM